MRILADLDSVSELQANADYWKPGIVLLDIDLLRGELSEFLENMKQILPGAKVVLMGPEPEAYYARHVGTMGADLYLSERLKPHEWTAKLKSVAIRKI